MTKGATSVTSSRAAGADAPSIDDLLKTGAFHKRLASARAAREEVLATHNDNAEQFLSGPKPWERPEYLRGEPRKTARPTPLPAKARSEFAAPAALPAAPEADPAPQEIATPPVATPVVAATTARWPRRLAFLAGGLAAGITLGVGVGYWAARSALPPAGPDLAIAAGAPTLAGSRDGGGQDAVWTALPERDNAPAATGLPELSHVTSVSATLPSIAGGGLVDPATAMGPRALPPEASATFGTTPALTLVSGPLPRRAQAPDLTATGGEIVFAGLPAPLPVAFTIPRAALPEGALTAPAPTIPDATPLPVALAIPEAVTPGSSADMPLAPQDLPPPVSPTTAGFILSVHAPATLSDTDIEEVAVALSEVGVETITPKPVDFTISETNIRYFHPADRAAAEDLAGALGARLRDFTGYSPSPPAGTIELWLAGKGTATAKVVTRSAATKKVHRRPQPSQADILKNRLIQQLRTGALN